MKRRGTSLAVQWLRLRLPMQAVHVRSLVGELRSHMPHGQKTKTQNRSNIITHSVKALKMVHIKKSLKRKDKKEKSQVKHLKSRNPLQITQNPEKKTVFLLFFLICFFRCLLRYHLLGRPSFSHHPIQRSQHPLHCSPSPRSASFFHSTCPSGCHISSYLFAYCLSSSLESKLYESEGIFRLLYISQHPEHTKCSMNVCWLKIFTQNSVFYKIYVEYDPASVTIFIGIKTRNK